MDNQELINKVNLIISMEIVLGMMELNEMNHCHEMGLQGYKRFHRFGAMDRQRHAIMLCNYVVEYHHVTPNIAMSFDSKSVPVSPTLIDALNEMYNASKVHLDLLKSTVKMAVDAGEYLLMGMLEKMLEDESIECERYHKEILALSFTKSDPSFIVCHSDELHKKYKEKEKEVFGYDDKKYGDI